MLANELILDAYRLGGITATDGESVDSVELVIGLKRLNVVIAKENILGDHIALLTDFNTTLIQGVQKTPIPNFIEILKVQYFLSANLRTDLERASLQHFYQIARLTNLQSTPAFYYPQRTKDGIDLNVYPFPNTNYQLEVHGIQALTKATLNSDIAGDTEFYIDYLTYLLAKNLLLYNQYDVLPEINEEIEDYKRLFEALRPTDYMVTLSPLGRTGRNYLDPVSASLMRGWYP